MISLLTNAKRSVVLVLVLGLFFAAGCSGYKSYSDDDWAKVKPGMSLEEVEKLLGKGEEIQQADYPNYPVQAQADTFRRWKHSANRTAWVGFRNGQLVAKQEQKPGP